MRFGIGLLVAILLSGCATQADQSAALFMREQQEKEAYLHKKEQQQAQELYKDQPAVLLSLIKDNIHHKKYFAANAYVNAYIQQFGSTPQVQLLQADTLRQIGHYTESKKQYVDLLKTNQKARALHGLGLIAAKQEQMILAIDLLQQASLIEPTNAVLLSDLGYAYMVTSQLDNARLPLGQAIELDPDNTRIVANTALLLVLEQQPQRATELMRASAMSASEQAEVFALASHFHINKPSAEKSTKKTPIGSASPNKPDQYIEKPGQPEVATPSVRTITIPLH